MKRFVKIKLVFIVSIILIILPFFWIKPGELNIGGDLGSLYYYDPINFIRHYAIYNVSASGTGVINTNYFFLPYVFVIAIIKIFLPPFVISVLSTSLILALGFLSIYWIVKELTGYKSETVAVLAGLFYILSPFLTIYNRYVNPISTLDQIFLNPLLFYLLLKYFLTKHIWYMWILLLITLIFSHNFSYTAAPALFSFYPLALVFLLVYVVFVRKKTVPIKGLLIGLVFFVGLHLFHIVPDVVSLIAPGSGVNTRVFNQDVQQANATYFYGVLPFASLAKHILLPTPDNTFWIVFSFVSPLIVILGFLVSRGKSKTFLFTGLLFLIALFFMSAKVTHGGVKFYEWLFLNLPGFGMFRNFYIQWIYVTCFFYALLFGQGLFFLYEKLNASKQKIFTISLVVFFIGNAWMFIKGESFNPILAQTTNVGEHLIMDPVYEKTLAFIRTLPDDGKILHFPFSDFDFQVVYGTGNGAYMGSSTIGQLTGKQDFVGYWHIAPYSEGFLQLSKEKNYPLLSEMFGLLNIRYIFHNSDSKIYDTTFLGRPYDYSRQFLPTTQKEYEEFIRPLAGEKLFEAGPYRLYRTKDESYLPQIYIPKETITYNYDPKYDRYYNAASSFILNKQPQRGRIAYIDKEDCTGKNSIELLCKKDMTFASPPNVQFKKINPTMYSVHVTNTKDSFILVFSSKFHPDWKLLISQDEGVGSKMLPETQHLPANAYANAWYIMPEDIDKKHDATFVIEMIGQRVFTTTSTISFSVLGVFVLWGVALIIKGKVRNE